MNQSVDLNLLQQLSPEEKRRLTARLLRERSGAAYEAFPLSHNQRALYVLHRLAPDSPAYHVTFPLRLLGQVDTEALHRACQALLDRHPSLRTRFFQQDGEPVQAVQKDAEVSFQQVDLSRVSPEERQRELQAIYRRPFDLATGPVARFTLASFADDDHVLLPVVHHIAIDGQSILIVLQELGALYRQYAGGEPARLPLLAYGYNDFVQQQQQNLASGGERLWQYWQNRLRGELPVLDIPTDLPRPAKRRERGQTLDVAVEPALTARLKTLASGQGVTLFTLVLAAYQVLLHRHSGQDDILVGCPDGSRPGAEYNRIVGYFVNPVVMRGDLSGNPPFAEFLQQLARGVLEAFAHREQPFAQLVERLAQARDTSRTPVFQAAFNFLQLPKQKELEDLFAPPLPGQQPTPGNWGGLPVLPFDIAQQEGQFDLVLDLFEARGALFGTFKFNTDLYLPDTIRRWWGHFLALLQAIADDPQQRVGHLPLLDADERRLLLQTWNASATDYPRDASIHQLFRRQATSRPDAVALNFGDAAMRYGELDALSDRLARRLQDAGLTEETPVAVFLERSFELVVALLAVLKAGGAFVPLPTNYPAPRLHYLLQDSEAAWLLSRNELLDRLPEHGATVLTVDCAELRAAAPVAPPETACKPEQLAYLMYTSGSSGGPKGVMATHRNVVRLVQNTDHTLLDDKQVFLMFAPVAFDASTLEIWGPLLNGGRLVIAPPGLASTEEIGRLVEGQGITSLWLSTALFHQIVQHPPAWFAKLNQVLTGGETISPQAVLRVLRGPAPGRLVNCYGPTENTTFSSFYPIPADYDAGRPVPIGKPIANSTVYIVDAWMNPVPIGIAGELLTGGDGVARGYWNRPALTEEKFVADPFSGQPGARLYRSGDRARFLADGNIEFLGRLDRQVKIRGFRIELAEIEQAIAGQPNVAECAVIARAAGDSKQLVAYVVTQASGSPLATRELRSALESMLPDYMVPASFVFLDKLPITANGKLDSTALPVPDSAEETRDYAPPSTPTEEILCGIWAELLGRERIGVQDNFFELGGHSLLSMRLAARLRDAFQAEIPLARLFECATPASQATLLAETAAGETAPIPASDNATVEYQPAFEQSRLWFLDRLEGPSPLYNIPLAFRLSGPLAADALQQALQDIVWRHDALRTVFPERDGAATAYRLEAAELQLPLVDLSDLPEAERQAALDARLQSAAQQSFDLGQDLLLKASLFRLQAHEHALLLLIHHIVGDGWSLTVFCRELQSLYASYYQGQIPQLPPLPIQYADYARWQRRQLAGAGLEASLNYWRQRLQGAPSLLDLPTDRPRPAIQSYQGASLSFQLPKSLHLALRRLARRHDATLFMTLQAAFVCLLARQTGSDDIVIGTPVANRPRAELEGLIGLFVDILVLRSQLDLQWSFAELLNQIRSDALSAYAHQQVPFERIIDALRLERNLSHAPLVQVVFQLENAPPAPLALEGLAVEAVPLPSTTAKFDITFSLVETADGLDGRVEYRSALFDAASIQRLTEQYRCLLYSVIENAEQSLAALNLLGEAEQALLRQWSDGAWGLPAASAANLDQTTLHRAFERQAQLSPDNIAASCDGRHLSYRELNRRANRLAWRLRELGVGPESLVGLYAERSLELVVGIIGILKAGGAYVPLDPAYPADRLAFMLEDARMSVLVAAKPEAAAELLQAAPLPVRLVSITDESPTGEADDQAPPEQAAGHNLAYAIYTSGSTGRPKGVLVEHRQVLRLYTACTPWFRFGADDVWTLFHSYAFDFSVWEFWGPLLYGGRLVVVPHATSRSPAAFFRLLRDEGVTMLNQTPSAFRQLVVALPEGEEAELPALRWIVFAGEAIDLPSVRLWMERYGERQPLLVNMYGITETTVHSSYRAISRADLDSASVSPIGRPLADLTIHLLDDRLKPVPVGVQGEIYVGGAGVTRGYLNRPELTAERFVPAPFDPAPGARLYKSGDLARWRGNGELEYLGRGDHQVKIRGFRIELGEIEAVLNRHPCVGAALVTVFQTAGDARLAAYLVAKAGENLSVDALRDHCRQCLPQYMVPAAFVLLDTFPLTPSGKIDRRALPAPGTERPELDRAYTPPETPAQATLAQVWAEVLKLERVGIDDNFFDLGGDSILSIQLLAQAGKRGLSFSLPDLFQHQTVRQLAAVAQTAAAETAPAYRAFSLLTPPQREALPEDAEDAYPLAALQAGMIFHSELDQQHVSYHDLLSLYLQGPYDPAALSAALQRLAAQHPILRTSFDLSAAGEPLQRVHRQAEIPLVVEDWRQLDEQSQEQVLADWISAEQQRPFDWKQAPLARVFLRRRGDDRFELSLSVHHAVLDGWSAATFYTGMLRDYLAQCGPAAARRNPPEAANPAPYAEFIALERQTLAEAASWDYWRQRLDGAVFTRLPRLSAAGNAPATDRAWPVPISAEVSDALKQLAKQAGLPLKSLLLTAHLYALGLLTGQTDITTGLVANGRPETAGGEQTLGLFLNTLPFRHRLAPAPWLELARAVAAQERELLPHRRFPLAEMQRRHGGELFETAFNFIHFHVLKDAVGNAGLKVLRERGFARTNLPLAAEFSLDVNRNDAVTLRLSVHSDGIDDSQLQTMADIYRRTLESIAREPAAVPYSRHILPPQEWQRVTQDFAWGRQQAIPALAAHDMVAAQAAERPDAVALAAGERQLTYAELDRRAETLAQQLRMLGMAKESLVGVALERGIDAVVALLAVLKAGAAYLPLDVSYPAERLAYMLEDAQPALLLSHSGLALPNWHGPRLYIDQVEAATNEASRSLQAEPAQPQQLAYVIYTSGSSGKPKGVLVEHRGLSNLVHAQGEAFNVHPGDRVLQFARLGFDASVSEIFVTLGRGATLVLAPPGELLAGAELARLLQQQRISVVTLPPSALATLPESALPDLHTLVVAGEACPAPLAARWSAGRRFLNAYGPTEATVCASIALYAGESAALTIGRPMANSQIFVLDPQGQPLPLGASGEIHIGGAGLARGYLQRPDLTTERFVDHPFQAGGRLYRSGDLGRWRNDGQLEFLGRLDAQVKLRGYRIELGEIEARLLEHPAITECLVLLREDDAAGPRLIAYLCADGTAPELAELHGHLRAFLPDYMVPAEFQVLDSLPRDAHGKFDRRALAAASGRALQRRNYQAPATPTQTVLADIWREVLRVEAVGIRDNFFELGGDSILSIQLVSKARDAGLPLSARQLFEQPDIESLAAALETAELPQAQAAGGKALFEPAPALAAQLAQRYPDYQDVYPLAPLQQGLLFESLYAEQDGGAYFEQPRLQLQGELDGERLRLAFQRVLQRHDALRAAVVYQGLDTPLQVICRQVALPWQQLDWRDLPAGEFDARLEGFLAEDRAAGFDFEQAPLLRLALLQRGDNDWFLVVSNHHLLLDGWSLPLLLGEAFALYRQPAAKLPPVRPYRDYLEWLANRERDGAEAFWRDRLAGCDAPAGPDLPSPIVPTLRVGTQAAETSDIADSATQSEQNHAPTQSMGAIYEEVCTALEAGAYKNLQAYARSQGLTLGSLCQGAWALLLSRYSRSEDVLFGVTVSGRPPELAGVERMVGLFINTVPVRVAVDEQRPLADWLAQLQADQAAAREHAYLPLSDIRRLSGVTPGQAWFDSLLIFENYPVDDSVAGGEGLKLVGAAAEERTHYPLSLLFMPGAELELRLVYDRSRFQAEAIERLGRHLFGLLQAMAAAPAARLCELPHLSATEMRQVCATFNATAAPLPEAACLHQGFERQVQRNPDAIALVAGSQRLSYRELDRRANRLANYLQSLGVGPETLVGLYCRRSADLALAVLGILKAGGAYLPLDPEYPKARIQYILQQAAPALVLTQTELAGELPEEIGKLRLDADWPLIEQQADQAPACNVSGANLAYVLYTSGSTGNPKGVAVEHRSGAAFMGWVGDAFRSEELAGVLFSTSICFDLSVFELFSAWWHGGKVILAKHALEFFDLPAKGEVSLINTVPSALAGLLNLGDLPANVLAIGMGGEALPDELARRVYRQPYQPRLLNLYGPTEDTVYSTWGEGDPGSDRAPDIGKPISNSQAYVLDELMRPQAVGIPGELYLGGAGLARGYLHRPDLTAERFVDHPFQAGGRLYRTGDLCRWRADGSLEYLGRLDHQIKLRGFRIELGEIESVLRSHPEVRDGAVLARNDQGSPRLVAYLVAQAGTAPTAGQLQAHLAASLPEYMLPAAWVFLEALPLTPNGKLDRRALPAPQAEAPASDLDAKPRNACEDLLCAIWATALARPAIGIHDDFFALGGDSILALQVVGKARQAGWQFSVRQLFQHPTVAELALQAEPLAAELRPQLNADAAPALTPIQHWFFQQNQPQAQHFNQALLLETPAALDAATLERAMRHLLQQHDALRQRFAFEADTVSVAYAAVDDEPLCAELDLSAVAEAELPAAIEAAANQVQSSLDLSLGPILRLLCMDLGPGHAGRLLITIHHLAVDWVSWWILLDDLARVYRQLQQGQAPQLPAKTCSFRDWSAFLSRQASAAETELTFWRNRPTPAAVPLDFPDGDNTVASSHELEVSLSETETRLLLQAVPEAYRTHIDDLLLTALAQGYAAWSGQTALQLDLESHGREDFDGALDLSRSVGWFTCLYPVRLALPAGDPATALKAVKEQLRRIPRKGLGWGLLRYLHPDPALRAELAALPPSQIGFNYLGQSDQSLPSSHLFAYAQESAGLSHSPERRRACPLEVNAYVSGGRLHCRFMYSENLHREASVLALAEQFTTALRALLTHCTAEGAGGRTPSDFPLAALSQAEVDRLAGNGSRIEDIYPLSPMQQGLLFHSLEQPSNGLYLEQLALELQGDLAADKLQSAWRALLQRHPVLRSGFAWEGLQRPLQIVQRQPVLPWRELDWRDLAAEEQAARLEALLLEDRKKGFHLTSYRSHAPHPSSRSHAEHGNDILLRLSLIRLGERRWQLLWSHHHLLLDGWSRPILLKELFDLYAGRALPPAPRPFRDYLAWLQQQDAEQAEQHWRQRLSGLEGPTPLPEADAAHTVADHTAPAAVAECRLPAAEAEMLEGFVRNHGLTWSTLARGAWALLLADYAGQDDVLFGATVAGRPPALAGVDGMVGMFVNTLPIRVEVPAEASVLPWLQALQTRQAEDSAFDFASLAAMQAAAKLSPGQALFDSLLVVENYPVDALNGGELPLRIAGLQTRERSSLPLVALLLPGREPALHLSYDPARYGAADAARLLANWRHRLLNLARQPQARLSELDPVTPEEKRLLLQTWNDTASEYPVTGCVHQLFRQQAALTPDAAALRFCGRSMSYAELDARSDALALRLQDLGIGPETRVGLCARRSLEMVVGLLAILKAGGAYLPLDPDYPADRLRYMIEDADLALLLAQPALQNLPDTSVPRLDLTPPASIVESAAAPSCAAGPDNAAYVIYTSGTTGRPKGVVLEHRGACNLAEAQRQAFGVGNGSRVLQFASLSFDAASWEILMALCAGGTLCLAPAVRLLPGLDLARFLREEAVGIATLPPSTLAAMPDTELPDLKTLIVAGEACPPDLLRRWATGRRFVNAYGPTETTVCATLADCRPEDTRPPIGKPLANTRAYVLDALRRPLPVGAVGELYIGGMGVARGYLNRPELTAERFVPDPFAESPDARLYRSGDLCRWRSDGQLEFLGRADQQIKIRGYRIEPGEIESLLRLQPGVADAAVLARQDGPGGHRLVAYLVAAADASLQADRLADALRQTLPAYMLPSAYLVLEALPLTPNGKLDRRALPAPEQPGATRPLPNQADPAVALIADAFATVLGLENVAADDDFFALGGHSLLATQLQWRLRELFQVELPLPALFEHASPAALARRLSQTRQDGAPTPPPLLPRDRQQPAPLSFAQERLYFLDRLEPGSAFYNSALAVSLHGPLARDALLFGLQRLLERHDVLRTRYPSVDGEPCQAVAADTQLALEEQNFSALPNAKAEAALTDYLQTAAEQAFDLAQGPLARFSLVKLGEQHHVLLASFHHSVFDGWSVGVFFRDLAAGYQACLANDQTLLPPALPLQYADYAQWQRDWLQGEALERELAYWRGQLAGSEPLQLPTDRPRPPLQSYRGDRVALALPKPLVADLTALGREQGATLFMTLLAAFKVLLYRYSGQSDLVVGTPVAGRSEAVLESLLGCFINLLPLRSDLADGPDFRQLLARIRRTTLDAFTHQAVPFEKLVQNLAGSRDPSRSPLFQAMFALQNQALPAAEFGGLQLEPVALAGGHAQYDLSLSLSETADGLAGELEYNSDLFDRASAERLAGHWQSLLQAVVRRPDCSIDRLPLLDAEQTRQLLARGCGPSVALPEAAAVHLRIAEQARRTPDAVAIVTGGEAWTYAKLDGRANHLALQLGRLNLAAGQTVAICLGRSPLLPLAMLAALKAGAAYLPLDPQMPAQRLGWMLQDSGAAALLTTRSLEPALAGLHAETWYLDSPALQGFAEQAPLSAAPSPAQPAYWIYTSGSTGTPKAVQVQHAALSNHAAWAMRRYRLRAGEKVLQFASASFDVAAEEIFPSLMAGACLQLRDDAALAPDRFGPWLQAQQVAVINLPSAFWQTWTEWLSGSGSPLPDCLRLLVVGSEKVGKAAFAAWRRLPGSADVQWLNAYGPTETAITATVYDPAESDCEHDGEQDPPIGLPVDNVRVYVLDRHLQLAPPGAAGELYIGGAGVALGYLGRPELTAAAFLPDPFAGHAEALMFKTGDRCRWRNDGQLAFLERCDQQIKIRGFRIEPGEIEALLARHPAVARAVVLARSDGGDTQLLAYLVATAGSDAEFDPRRYLQDLLPEYMLPAAFVWLESLPLTASGKIDRQALTATDLAAAESKTVYQAPRDEIERGLATIWSELLGACNIGLQDDFFALGGHSLLALRAAAMIRQRFGRSLPLAGLFQAASLAAWAEALRNAAPDDDSKPLSPSAIASPGNVVLRPLQAQGDGPALFCVAPPPASGLCYAASAAGMGKSRPLYSLESGLENNLALAADLTGIAASYLAVLRQNQARGPYWLSGWSLGGLIAFEMAQQLAAAGEEVRQLILLDTLAPGAAPDPYRPPQDASELLRQFCAGLGLPGPISGESQALASMRAAGLVEPGFDAAALQRSLATYAGQLRAASAYQPASYAGNTILLRAADIPSAPGLPDLLHDPAMGWQRYCVGRLSVERLPGDHLSMLREPNAAALARQLQQILDADPTIRG